MFDRNKKYIFDGGMGQALLAKGLKPEGTLWSATALIYENLAFSLFLRLWAQKGVFCEKVHFCAPMPRMLIKPIEN